VLRKGERLRERPKLVHVGFWPDFPQSETRGRARCGWTGPASILPPQPWNSVQNRTRRIAAS
jgi:hypothetical protein